MKIVSQTVAFLLEIAMLISFCYCGFKLGKTVAWQYLLAVLLPLIAVVVWGIWAAPKSASRLRQPVRMFLELAIFITSAILLYKTGKKAPAAVFAGLAILSEITALILGE